MSVPIILAIETASRFCSVAVSDHNGLFHQRAHFQERGHTKQVLPLVEALLDQLNISLSDIEAIAYGKGPGSFTGIRVGISFAQGLAISLNKPLIAVSSLSTVIQSALNSNKISVPCTVIAGFDARMDESYFCVAKVENQQFQKTHTDRLLKTDQINLKNYTDPSCKTFAVGSAFKYIKNMGFSDSADFIYDDLEPDAEALLSLAIKKYRSKEFTSVSAPDISYLRDNVIQS